MIVVGSDAPLPAEAAGTPRFSSWHEFARSGAPAEGFWLAGFDDAQLGETLAALRKSAWWDRPVFGGAGTVQHPALDAAASWSEARSLCERTRGLRESLKLETQAMQFDQRLLYYLYQREPGELRPQLDRHSLHLYRYPVADLLAEGAVNVDAWLTSLTRRGLLEPAGLVDRTRHCTRCTAAHLHFLDVCPHCESMHIHKGSSLHCFSCGHVAPEADFMADRGLGCPKCSTRLRHIGVDYDRPLTQYTCSQCHHAFIEAAVQARCLECGHAGDPEQLQVREVSSLRLSLRGRAALRAGQIRDTFAALEGVGFAPLEQFKGLVDWALITQQRHPELQFGLVMVELANALELVEAHGAPRAYLMLDEFARRLRELLRNSDVSTRTSEDRLWVFLPYASTEGFLARLRKALDIAPAGGGPRIELRTAAMSAPHDVAPGERIEALMARLQEQQG